MQKLLSHCAVRALHKILRGAQAVLWATQNLRFRVGKLWLLRSVCPELVASRYSFAKGLFLASMLLIFSGCSSLPDQPTRSASPLTDEAAKPDPGFVRQGRFSLRVNDRQGDLLQTLQGNFRWSEFPHGAQLDLSSPFGQTLARLQMTPGQAILFQADKPPEYAQDVDTLMLQLLGWPLSVKAFPYWLRGQTQTLTAKEPLPNSDLIQDEAWQVEMRDFDAWGPTRLSIKRILKGGQILELKLVISIA